MERDTIRMRAGRPYIFAQLKNDIGLDDIIAQLCEIGGLSAS